MRDHINIEHDTLARNGFERKTAMQVQPLRRCLQIAPHLSHPALGRGKADPVTRGIERPAHQRGIVTPPLVEATPDFDRKFFNGFHHRTNITFYRYVPHIRATISPGYTAGRRHSESFRHTSLRGESLKPAKPLVLFRFFHNFADWKYRNECRTEIFHRLERPLGGEHTFEFEAGDDLFRLFENTEIKSGHCDVKVNLYGRHVSFVSEFRSGAA